MKINKLKKILLFFIVLSIIVSLFQVTIRINAERKENTVDVTLDYPDFYLFSATNGQNVYDTIEEMREAGATSAAVVEDCIETLYGEGKITFFNGSDLLAPSFNNILRSKLEIDKHRDIIQPSFVVVLTENGDLAERMLSNLSEDTGFIDGDGVYAIIIHSDILTAVEYGVGFDNEKIEKLEDMGFQIVLRPRYTPGNRNVETLVNTIKEFNIKSVMFYGEVITGYPDRVDELANFFNENHILTYIIESPIQKGIYSQEGLSAFIRKVHHYVVRVYSIYPAEQVKLTALEIFNRWFRSIPDRNIRVIYVKPIIGIGANYEQNLSTNKYYINKLITLWKEKGMEFGMPHPIDEVSVHWIVVFLIYLGVIHTRLFSCSTTNGIFFTSLFAKYNGKIDSTCCCSFDNRILFTYHVFGCKKELWREKISSPRHYEKWICDFIPYAYCITCWRFIGWGGTVRQCLSFKFRYVSGCKSALPLAIYFSYYKLSVCIWRGF